MATTSRATLKGYFNTGDTPTEGNFQDLIDSALNLQDGGTIIATGSGMISFASGSTDAFHASAPPFIPHLIPGLKVWSIAGSDNPSAAGLPVADNATTGPWLFDDANKSYLMTYNPDFALRSHMPYILHQADMMATYIEGDMWNEKKSEPISKSVPKDKQEQKKVDNLKNKFDELFAN